jgi:tRNA modification GTPase
VLLVDATQGETSADRDILDRMPASLPRVRVMNKIDLHGRSPSLEREDSMTTVWLSAKTGAGLDLLKQAVLQAIGWQAGSGEGLFMARARHVQALQEAERYLERAHHQGGKLELFAEELRLAQEALASITGEFSPEDLLGEIFGRFCIGK